MSAATRAVAPFFRTHAVAAARKGSPAALKTLAPRVLSDEELAGLPDSLVLAAMTKIINRVQFNWEVIEKKWPQFDDAFLGFDVARLAALSDEDWDAYFSDARIVRSGAKIKASKDNVFFIQQIAQTHGSFGTFLADWPADDQAGLMAYLKKNGGRLGGQTGAWVLRKIGWDAYVLTPDVVTVLQEAGCEIADQPTSKRDLARAQAAFTQWRDETGLGYAEISRIAACSIGQNLDSDYILDQARRYFE